VPRPGHPCSATRGNVLEPEAPENLLAPDHLLLGEVGRGHECEQIAVETLRRRLQAISSDRVQASSQRSWIVERLVVARAIREAAVDVDDRANERELGAEQPISLFRWAKTMGAHEHVTPV
jgi:hypothetical protein